MQWSKKSNNSTESFDMFSASVADVERQRQKSSFKQNPIIVIPGILGSNITNLENENTLWGDFGRSFADPKADENLRMIALPMQIGKTLDQLQSKSSADGSLRFIKGRVAGVPISINTYAGMMSAMGVGDQGGVGGTLEKLDDYIDDYRDHTNAFEFGYDWRRSVDENAARLADYICEVTRFVQLQRGTYDPVKFDIVAHSMGGLITRYYLQYGSQLMPEGDAMPITNWAGSAQVERVILIGPPNGGSLLSLESLLIGVPKNPVTPRYDPVILGTLPAVYQLLPRFRHKTFMRSDASLQQSDLLNADLWIDMNWGLADSSKDVLLRRLLPGAESKAQRREIALDHLHKCLRAAGKLQYALDNVTARPEHLQMFVFVGESIKTPLMATAKKGDKNLTFVRKGAGDGTVPRASALLDDRVGGQWQAKIKSPLQWDNVIFLSSNHLGMTKDPLCIKNILYILLEKP